MQELKEKMQKTIDSTKRHFSSIRTGRANPDLLDRIQVDYYGTLSPLKSVASISAPDASTLMVNVFDRNAVKNVEKAIMTSDLGINPRTEGSTIILAIPVLTEDRRKELIKIVKKSAEEGKISIRNIRREYIDKLKKDKELPEDESKKLQDDAQKETDKSITQIETLIKDKEKEIMTV